MHFDGGLATALGLSLCAGVCSAFGGVLAVVLEGRSMTEERVALWHAALGGALLSLGACDLLPEAAAGLSATRAACCFAVGAAAPTLAARVVAARACRTSRDRHLGRERGEVLAVGLAVCLSLSAHNLLEGIGILLAAQDGVERGARLAAAVGLENVPEGMCIALPVLYATRSPRTAVRYALVSGMMEPIGVLLMAVFARPRITQLLVSSVLAVVSGILVSLALSAILPVAANSVALQRRQGHARFNAWSGFGIIVATMLQPMMMFHGRIGSVR